MIIQYSPDGLCVAAVQERSWTSGDVIFDEGGIASEGEHDSFSSPQPYQPCGSVCYLDTDRSEWLEDFLRPVNIEDVSTYYDGHEITVHPWPEHWSNKARRAVSLSEACESFTEVLQYAPKGYFDDAALKVLDIFGHGRMRAELVAIKAEIAAWRLTDEAKALDVEVDDDPQET